MRRGSVTTYVDDGRRHSEGMVTPEFRRSSSIARHEFSITDGNYEKQDGCFVSYRKIAFAFVFLLAVIIAGAFIGVYLNMPGDAGQDTLTILSKEEQEPESYVLSSSVKPLSYRVELQPSLASGGVRVQGRVFIDFAQDGSEAAPNQLVLNSKHLAIKSYRLEGEKGEAEETAEVGTERSKRDLEETNNAEATTEAVPVTTEDSESSQNNTIEKPILKTELDITGNKTDETSGVYVLFLSKPLNPGNYSLQIEYETKVDDRVIEVANFTRDGERRLLLVSKLKPVNAPRLFPTFDEAKLKASFVLTLSHPPSTKVLSNTPLANSSDMSEDLQVDTFTKTQIMSAHNLAFAMGNIDHLGEIVFRSPQHNILYWGDASLKSRDFYLKENIAAVASTYRTFFGKVAPPTGKLDLLGAPIDSDGLSQPGLIVMRESLFYAAVNSSSLKRTEALLNLIGLVGQQWLGGLVDAKNWTDAWYIEGSALYFQYAFIDKIDQSLEASDNFLIDVQMEAMENDGYILSKALDSRVDWNRIEAFDLEDVYKKGACLISMLHAVVGESTFRSGYADFLRRWKYSRANSEVFLETLIGNATIEAEPPMSLFGALASWTRQSGYPLINVTWDRNNRTITVSQSKFNFDESSRTDEEEEPASSKALWWVPLTYVTGRRGEWLDPTLVWLKAEREIVLKNATDDESDWIVFNVNRTGYYRVNYDRATWAALGRALREQHEALPVRTRAALIDDALSLARQGALGYEAALDLLAYLGPNERNCAPWQVLAWHATQLQFALYETPAYPSFQVYMRNLVSTLFDEIESKIDEGSPLVMLAMRLACLFEYQRCTNWAKDKWEEMIKGSQESQLAEHMRETVYCVGAQHGGQEDLAYLMEKFSESSSGSDEKDRILSALGCFQTPWILQEILNEILETDKYEHEDVRMILRSYAKNPAAAQAVRRFVQVNWKQIVARFHKSYWTMKAFVEASTSLLFTERDLNEFNAFRDQNIESLKALKGQGYWVALREMMATSWIFRLKESSSSIHRWLKNHTASAL